MNLQQLPPEERRYDREALEKIIAIAARLQQEHHETLSVAQIEEIGKEVGVAPAFIRQALASADQIQTQSVATRPTRRVLSRTEILQALLPALGTGVSLGFLLTTNQPSPFFLLGLAPIVAIALGFRARSRRLGAAGGATLGLSLFLTAALKDPGGGVLVALYCAGIGAALGTSSAALRRWWDRIPHTPQEATNASHSGVFSRLP